MEGDGDTVANATVRVTGDAGPLKKELKAAADLGKSFATTIITAFKGIGTEGKSLGDVFRGLALDLSKLVLNAALKPLNDGFGNLLSGLFQQGFGALTGAQSGLAPTSFFAKGGVIQSPIGFPLSGGGLGVAGERGAEAILPLARGPDGHLGVKAQGGGGGVSVTFNVATPDADSFRKSESQVAAMLARAVTSGHRNL